MLSQNASKCGWNVTKNYSYDEEQAFLAWAKIPHMTTKIRVVDIFNI